MKYVKKSVALLWFFSVHKRLILPSIPYGSCPCVMGSVFREKGDLRVLNICVEQIGAI